MGIGRPRPALSRLRVKTAKRTIVPLSVDEVARFWSSFRNSRDLAIVGLMLLQGLRSQEVLDLQRDDLLLRNRRSGCAAKATRPASCRWPRRRTNSLTTICGSNGRRLRRTLCLFPSKARSRRPYDSGRIALLFRYHRRTTGVKKANPTAFAIHLLQIWCAGVSLPALMQLMGHARIETTMVYVEVTPLEVYQQYAKAVAQHIRPVPGRAVKLPATLRWNIRWCSSSSRDIIP